MSIALFGFLRSKLNKHLAGEADNHAADKITYTGNVPEATSVQEGLDRLHTRVEEIITTPPEGVSAQEIIDARKGKTTLRAKMDDLDSQLAETRAQGANNALKISRNLIKNTRSISESKTMVTFIDDDGYDGVLDILKPMFISRGIPCVVALRGDSVILQTEEKREQLRDLQNNHGWEMASHTMTHIRLSEATDEEIEEDSINFLNLMYDYGLDVESIVYPWGAWGNTSVISKYYRAGFGTTNGINDINLDDYNIGREILGNSPSRDLQFYKDMIDSIEDKPVWLVFMMHISDPATDVQQVEDVIDYVLSKNIPVVTAREGLRHYGSLINSRENKSVEPARFQIKPNGIIKSSRYLLNFLGKGDNGVKVTGDTLPSEFDIGTTTSYHTNPSESKIPFSGIMVTTKTIATNGYARQVLLGTSSSVNGPINIVYRTALSGADNWGAWMSLNGYLWFVPTENTPPTDYPFGETIRLVTGWSNGNGMVKTINSNPAQVTYLKQIFYKASSNRTFIRSVNSSGTWNDWQEINMT